MRVEHFPVHGGSLRIYAGRKEQYGQHAAQATAWAAQEERNWGMNEMTRYERFTADVEENRWKILDLLKTLKKEGKTIAGYGAPAKGNTLLNYCGIGSELLPFIVDKNPMKVGLYTPGMHIPVLPVSALIERLPDYVLILAWNLAEEIMEQQRAYQDRGGKFIIPIPEPRII